MLDNLDAEVRSGYKVSEKRKKVWNIQLELAEEVKKICDKHSIQYFIIGHYIWLKCSIFLLFFIFSIIFFFHFI